MHVRPILGETLIHISINIGVNVPIDVDVPVSAPHAAAVPIAIVSQDSSHRHAGAKTQHRSGRHCAGRIIVIGISDRITSINNGWIILRNIDDIRLRRLNLHDLICDNDSLLLDDICDDLVCNDD